MQTAKPATNARVLNFVASLKKAGVRVSPAYRSPTGPRCEITVRRHDGVQELILVQFNLQDQSLLVTPVDVYRGQVVGSLRPQVVQSFRGFARFLDHNGIQLH